MSLSGKRLFTQHGYCSLSPSDAHKLRTGVSHGMSLGDRYLSELLVWVVEHRPDLTELLARLAEAKDMTRASIVASGGDRFPPRPLRQVLLEPPENPEA